ncbi:unnamed protein product [Protopolystoma xenopodis]|uniref:Uncharacterized protein n=1 Tax=Protopolystoma xenopodis TaxID=117903 RepID=A0A448X075_9PLAT|nr:unnamed protein product [Protopolystoma xenopodis]
MFPRQVLRRAVNRRRSLKSSKMSAVKKEVSVTGMAVIELR